MKAQEVINAYPHDSLGALRELKGYYVCPKDKSGKRQGPLVGYAGEYEPGKQWVGDVYANFAKMEEYPSILSYFAMGFLNKFYRPDDSLVFCGAPLGGMAFATILATLFHARYVFMEKKIIALATEHQREQSKLIFSRHGIARGDRVVVTEDVTNNFSTTDKMVGLIETEGGSVIALATLLNRSLYIDNFYAGCAVGGGFPVDSLVRKPIQQWKQDDPEVAEDIVKGNVIWKPKNDWDELERAMKECA